jgi:hypothetical protein
MYLWVHPFMLGIHFLPQFLCFPIIRQVHNGLVFQITLNHSVALQAVWSRLYLLSLLLGTFYFIWGALKMDATVDPGLFAAFLVTKMDIHTEDQINKTIPCEHSYPTALVGFFWWNWQPHLRRPRTITASIIMLSNIFTGRHKIKDRLEGKLWAEHKPNWSLNAL